MSRCLINLPQFRRRRVSPPQLQPSPLVPLVNTPENPPPQILKLTETMPENFPRFGPLFGEDEPFFSAMKQDAWKLVKESGADEKSVTKETYFSAIGRVEQDARDRYVDSSFDLTSSEFRRMMIRDGCFFLHLALLLLGASEHLGYPVGHGIFGRGRNKGDINRCIKAMLFVGNQIPIVVLKELMKQSFFRQVVRNQGKWERPRGIFRRALFEFLVFQPTAKRGILLMMTRNHNHNYNNNINSTTDLIHGIQCLVLGSGATPKTDDTEIDVELGGQDVIGIENDDRQRFLSATQMERVGIGLKRSRAGATGAKGIKFSTNIFGASLYLPGFLVDDDIEVVFQSLVDYERCHNMSPERVCNKWEVSSYLRLMKDLLRSPEDINLLEKRGIVMSCDLRCKEKLIGILGGLRNCEGYITPELDTVGLLTRHYSSPAVWGNLKNFLGVVISFLVSFALIFVLTFLQTYYTVYDHYNSADKAVPVPPLA